MYSIVVTNPFKKALKRCIKRGLDRNELEKVVDLLAQNGSLPQEYRPHKLNARFNYAWECHIKPDWLLIWQQKDETLTLLLLDTGTHSDIFG